jgi:uncharacterized LabA/DUF88 family protein
LHDDNLRRIALFLDFENLVTNTGFDAANFDLQPSVDRLLEKGKVIYRRAYADWSRFKDAKRPLHELGVELIDVPPSTRTGKNGADMRLVIDALELCYAREYIDTFVIGSGDSDFCPLAYKLRENDRHVIGIGVRESTSRLFVKACDEFIYLKPPAPAQRAEETKRKTRRGGKKASAASAAREKEAKAELGEKAEEAAVTETAAAETGAVEPEVAAPAASEHATEAAPEPAAETHGKKKAAHGGRGAHKPRAVPEIAREVVSSLLARATGPINPSLIKETIVRKQPDFDEREHGFSTFSKMLEAMEAEGLLKRQQIRGRQWYVVPAEVAAPAEAAPVQASLPLRDEPGADDGDYEEGEGPSDDTPDDGENVPF